jgi:WD and tetratricopeptide repeat-containing protein 1
VSEYKRKYRSLAATYVEFSPDGKELLVNLGGEQIYIFPMRCDLQKTYDSFFIPQLLMSPGKSI